jgi:phosphoribosylformylglycinamidine synthase
LRRLGGSSFAACFGGQLGDVGPDVDANSLKKTFAAVQQLLKQRLICAGHDVSDGGLLTCVLETLIATGCGAEINLVGINSVFHESFAQEPGYVMECPLENVREVANFLKGEDVSSQVIGWTKCEPKLSVVYNGQPQLNEEVARLRRIWERTSFEFAKGRIDPGWVRKEQRNTRVLRKPKYHLAFTPEPVAPAILLAKHKPKACVIREKGTNGHDEMLEAWENAGFKVLDVHMSDLRHGTLKTLDAFQLAVLPGGFADGDHPGAAVAQAMSIHKDPRLKEMFRRFMSREDTLSFGVCNGAQLGLRCGWAPLPDLPAEQRPYFTRNQHKSFIHDWIRLKVQSSKAVMTKGMAGSILGAYVANGEGYFNCDHDPGMLQKLLNQKQIPLIYVDALGRRTKAPPHSPSGSFVAGVCDPTGRHLYMMPHAFDRGFQLRLWQYVPSDWRGLSASPWMKMGQNAYEWLKKTW